MFGAAFRKQLEPSKMNLKIAITMGDPSGIGPEIIAKAFAEKRGIRSSFVIGDVQIMKRAIRLLDLSLIVRIIERSTDAKFKRGQIDLLCVGDLPPDIPIGRVDQRSGRAAFGYVSSAVELALRGDVNAIVTAPLNKKAMHAAGIPYSGHTEILAEMTGTSNYGMMLLNDKLRVILVTAHLPLAEAICKINVE